MFNIGRSQGHRRRLRGRRTFPQENITSKERNIYIKGQRGTTRYKTFTVRLKNTRHRTSIYRLCLILLKPTSKLPTPICTLSMMTSNYPLSDTTSLKEQFLGQKLVDLPTPSIILDRNLTKKNCTAMLQICKKLDVGFRAHVKSHKTLELSRIQVGDGLPGLENTPAQFIVSTLAEAENLAEYVRARQQKGSDAGVSLHSIEMGDNLY